MDLFATKKYKYVFLLLSAVIIALIFNMQTLMFLFLAVGFLSLNFRQSILNFFLMCIITIIPLLVIFIAGELVGWYRDGLQMAEIVDNATASRASFVTIFSMFAMVGLPFSLSGYGLRMAVLFYKKRKAAKL